MLSYRDQSAVGLEVVQLGLELLAKAEENLVRRR